MLFFASYIAACRRRDAVFHLTLHSTNLAQGGAAGGGKAAAAAFCEGLLEQDAEHHLCQLTVRSQVHPSQHRAATTQQPTLATPAFSSHGRPASLCLGAPSWSNKGTLQRHFKYLRKTVDNDRAGILANRIFRYKIGTVGDPNSPHATWIHSNGVTRFCFGPGLSGGGSNPGCKQTLRPGLDTP